MIGLAIGMIFAFGFVVGALSAALWCLPGFLFGGYDPPLFPLRPPAAPGRVSARHSRGKVADHGGARLGAAEGHARQGRLAIEDHGVQIAEVRGRAQKEASRKTHVGVMRESARKRDLDFRPDKLAITPRTKRADGFGGQCPDALSVLFREGSATTHWLLAGAAYAVGTADGNIPIGTTTVPQSFVHSLERRQTLANGQWDNSLGFVGVRGCRVR